eukprot:6214668-Pleurochrysis_carterae.AAC.1
MLRSRAGLRRLKMAAAGICGGDESKLPGRTAAGPGADECQSVARLQQNAITVQLSKYEVAVRAAKRVVRR